MAPTIASLTSSITTFVGDHSVYAVFLLLMIDAVFPAASELVMVYGGALAAGAVAGQVTLFGSHITSHFAAYLVIAVAGTLGYLVGALIGYAIGAAGGRPLLERHGRWFHLGPDKLERADRWFERRGRSAVLIGRVTPVIRSFVSIPAGYGEVPLAPYTVLTLIGSAVWCFVLAGVGLAVGDNYEKFNSAFDIVSVVVVVAVIGGVGYFFWRRRQSAASRADRRPL